MPFGRKHSPTPSGADASRTAPAAALEPVSPLPRAVEVFVPAGSYGAAPHVPFAPYVPPLPPKLQEADAATTLRVVTEDPLAFLAAQAAAHPPASGELGAAPGTPATRRFSPTGGAPSGEIPVSRQARRGSVPPPGFR